jgi:hypothetical protein
MSNAGDGIPSHDEQAGGLFVEQWRTAFLAGAESHRLLLHAQAIGVTDTLRMLWKEGKAPSVQDVLGVQRASHDSKEVWGVLFCSTIRLVWLTGYFGRWLKIGP